jgi:hypothetical protein
MENFPALENGMGEKRVVRTTPEGTGVEKDLIRQKRNGAEGFWIRHNVMP